MRYILYVMSASHLKTGAENNLVTADGVPTPLEVISRRVSAGSRGDRTPLTEIKKLSNYPQNWIIETTLLSFRGQGATCNDAAGKGCQIPTH